MPVAAGRSVPLPKRALTASSAENLQRRGDDTVCQNRAPVQQAIRPEGRIDGNIYHLTFMKPCYHGFMKVNTSFPVGELDEYLQIQVPSVTKHALGMRSAETREPIRVIVLRALKAYGVIVPDEAITDRRKGRSA